jgi:hypothetical protein
MNSALAIEQSPLAAPAPVGCDGALILSTALLLVIWFIGTALNLAAYMDANCVIAGLVMYALGGLLVFITSRQHLALQFAVYSRLFAIGWLMAGIGAIYAEVFRDPLQLGSDAATFFELARSDTRGLPLEDLGLLTESAGAVFTWRAAYESFAAFGFERSRYIGLLVNVVIVAFSGIVALRCALLMYGFDVPRLRRMQVFVAGCGLFWLFSAIHLRDGFVLLVAALSVQLWLQFLRKPGTARLLWLLLLSLPLYAAFAVLRPEFVYLPALMCIGALVALGLSRAGHSPALAAAVIIGGALAAAGSWYLLGESFLAVFQRGTEAYSDLAAVEASADSLGMKLVMNQPAPIRLVLGSAQLFTMPIPFWMGFQTGNAAVFFKSMNAIFFYGFTPLVVLAAWRVIGRRELRTPINLFLLISFAACTAAIALTSLESRHFGAFLVPGFCLALVPALDGARDGAAYRLLLQLYLTAVALVHIAWLIIKAI